MSILTYESTNVHLIIELLTTYVYLFSTGKVRVEQATDFDKYSRILNGC